MANEFFKELKTRIALKTLDLAGWEAIKETYKPLKGEVCVCEIPTGNNVPTANSVTPPTVLFKVGDGEHFWKDLNWASALAADVYSWAKKSESEFITWVNTIVKHPAAPEITTGNANGTIAVDGTDVAVKGLGSAAYTNADAYATSEQGTKADNAATTIAKYGDIVTHNVSEFAPHNIDTGVHSVELAGGTNNGTLKLTVDGNTVDNIAVTGLGDAAYTTVDTLNTTAKGYADAVLGNSGDAATANTVYGAKAAAAAAQSDATIAKTKIETFLGTITPDGSQDIIDTLAEINKYVGDHGQEFSSLSGKVTNIENGTTHTIAKSLDDAAIAQVEALTVADSNKLGGAAAADYLKKAEAVGYNDILTKTEAPSLYQAKGDYASKA